MPYASVSENQWFSLPLCNLDASAFQHLQIVVLPRLIAPTWHVLCAPDLRSDQEVTRILWRGLIKRRMRMHRRQDTMAMQRWDPFGDMLSLREAMDRLLQDSFVRPASQMLGGRGAMPLDLAETDNDYVVSATMPGVKPEEVQISIQGDQLTIRADTRTEENREGQNWIVHERRSASFNRTLTLPGPVNVDQAEAQYENGVLTLRLPKAEQARPKQIKVRGGAAGAALPGDGHANVSINGPTPQNTAAQGSTTSQTSQPPTTSPEGFDRVTDASEQSFPASDPPSY